MSIDESDASARMRYEGYSDYRTVSQRVGEAIDRAIEAYAGLQSMHMEGARVKPDQAADARARILAAAMRLVPELEHEDEEYEDILDRWMTPDEVDADTATPDELGYLKRLDRVQLTQGCPDWLHQFVLDIRTAGFEIGYLRAGRTVDEGPDDVVERDAEAMFS